MFEKCTYDILLALVISLAICLLSVHVNLQIKPGYMKLTTYVVMALSYITFVLVGVGLVVRLLQQGGAC